MFLLALMALLGAAGPGVGGGPGAAPLLVVAPALCCVKLGRAGLALTSCARLSSSLQETGTDCRHRPFPQPTPLHLHGVVVQRGKCALCIPVLILPAPSLLPSQGLQEVPHGGPVYAVLCQLWVWARGQLWLSPSLGAHCHCSTPGGAPAVRGCLSGLAVSRQLPAMLVFSFSLVTMQTRAGGPGWSSACRTCQALHSALLASSSDA